MREGKKRDAAASRSEHVRQLQVQILFVPFGDGLLLTHLQRLNPLMYRFEPGPTPVGQSSQSMTMSQQRITLENKCIQSEAEINGIMTTMMALMGCVCESKKLGFERGRRA